VKHGLLPGDHAEAQRRRAAKEVEVHENQISEVVVDAAIKVHRALGPGLLELVYKVILAQELRNRGLTVTREVPVPIRWEGLCFEEGFRLDLLVEDKVIVEVKAQEKLPRVARRQILTYLRLANKRLGLLMNFGEELLKDGITRVVNGLDGPE